jgi:hypothetical protein
MVLRMDIGRVVLIEGGSGRRGEGSQLGMISYGCYCLATIIIAHAL